MSTSALKAFPGKLGIKRHSPSILYLCTVESLSLLYLLLYLDLYVLGDDAWINQGSFMQFKHLCVLIHI